MARFHLSGRYEHTLDPKGRVTLPARYREHFRAKAILVRLPRKNCVSVYDPEAWAAYDEKYLEPLDVRGNRQDDWEIRNTFGNLADVVPDSQGRVLVAAHHIEDLSLGSKVLIIGNRDHLEIWNPETYAAEEAKWRGGNDD